MSKYWDLRDKLKAAAEIRKFFWCEPPEYAEAITEDILNNPEQILAALQATREFVTDEDAHDLALARSRRDDESEVVSLRELREQANRPQSEWVGGLPGVGEKVEVWVSNGGYWAQVSVLAVDVDTVIWRNGTDRASYIGTHIDNVRPIPTKAQRDRDEVVAAAVRLEESWMGAEQFAAKLYEAGMLQHPKEQDDDQE